MKTAVSKRTQNMPVNDTNIQFGTGDPPGSREGFGDIVHPSRQCLPATSSESEISRSQSDTGLAPTIQCMAPSVAALLLWLLQQ